jgi:peptidoglycan-N-acetylglucosamine deacetylase
MLTPVETGLGAGLGAVAAVGLAAGGWSYASLWPGSHIFGRALTAPARPGELALTFDDGPNPAWTPALLDLLEARGVRATFFMIGRHAQTEPELVRRVAAAGHIIGNHSWSHPNLARSAAARIREELVRTQQTLEQTMGAPVRWFRPPYGARRPAVFRIARELGLEPVLWNAMTTDWKERSAERIAARLAAKIDRAQRSGYAANIVLHDGNHRERRGDRGPSVGAAELLLKRYGQTQRFVTVEQWPVVREQGLRG